MSHRLIAVSAALLVAGSIGVTVATRPKPRRQDPPRLVVRLALTADGQDIATLSTPSGTMATMAVEGGEEVGLTPDVEGNRVTLAVSVKNPATGEFTVVGRYTLHRNQPADVSTPHTRLQVEWLETVDMTVSALTNVTPQNGPCSTCCIVCDGKTICACEVNTSCGYCCCPEHCSCSGGSPRRPRT